MPKKPTTGIDFKKLGEKMKADRVAEKKLEKAREEFKESITRSKKWSQHKETWSTCNLCQLYNKRCKIVLGKGQIPCKVLLCGEAPGQSEDVLGKPFVGQAGHLLEEIVTEALFLSGNTLDTIPIAYTNLVACIPKVYDITTHQEKIDVPDEESVKACSSRLTDFVRLCKPRAIVMVGKLSQKFSPKYIDWDFDLSIDIYHPAAILRLDETQQSLGKEMAIDQTLTKLKDFFVKVAELDA